MELNSTSGLGETDTRVKLIDPAIHACGWHEDMIRREETAGTIEIIGGKARRRARGQVDYILRLKIVLISKMLQQTEAKRLGGAR